MKKVLNWIGGVIVASIIVASVVAANSGTPTQPTSSPAVSAVSSVSSPIVTPSPIATPVAATSPDASPSPTPSPKSAIVPVSPKAVTKPVVKASPVQVSPLPTVVTKTETNECDPNYSGACVPIANDVDCAGGSGNGPAYVRGPVTVIGRDIYDLDRDGDGSGCEN